MQRRLIYLQKLMSTLTYESAVLKLTIRPVDHSDGVLFLIHDEGTISNYEV